VNTKRRARGRQGAYNAGLEEEVSEKMIRDERRYSFKGPEKGKGGYLGAVETLNVCEGGA